MNRLMKLAVQLILVSTLLILSAAPGFAAEVRRVPSKASVEQGFAALTIGVEGSDDFQYIGLEDKNHMYRGTIKPGSKLQFTIVATLAEQKSLPITGRSCIMRLKVVAKKGDEVIKTQNFSKENKSNVFVNYTVPAGADTLEVSETFVLSNKSKDQKFNQRVTSLNKLILTTAGAGAAGTVAKKTGENDGGKNTDKKDNAKDAGGDKNTTGSDKKDSGDNGKADAKESKGPGMGMLVGAVVAVAAIGGGAFFYMKKRKEGQAAAEEIARKEKLRQQAILRQQELQQQNRQREAEQQRAMQQQHEAEQQRLMQEEQMREQEQARQQQMQREAEQQRLMQEQNAMQQPGATGAYVAGAAGVMGGVQQNAAENAMNDEPNAAPKFCTNCGSPLKPGSKFCVNCGAKL